jgi:hypothetical protein
MLAAVGALALLLAACGSTATASPANPSGNPPTTPPQPTPTIVMAQQSQSGKDATAAQISVTATCPGGTTLVSGGYALGLANNTQLVLITDDYPDTANSWKVTEANPQSGGAITLTPYAYCLKSSTPISNHIASGLSGTDGKAVAACQTNTIVTGGYDNANGAGPIITGLMLASGIFTVTELNMYVPPTTGPGGAPPTPSPLQLAAYGVCVTAS